MRTVRAAQLIMLLPPSGCSTRSSGCSSSSRRRRRGRCSRRSSSSSGCPRLCYSRLRLRTRRTRWQWARAGADVDAGREPAAAAVGAICWEPGHVGATPVAQQLALTGHNELKFNTADVCLCKVRAGAASRSTRAWDRESAFINGEGGAAHRASCAKKSTRNLIPHSVMPHYRHMTPWRRNKGQPVPP